MSRGVAVATALGESGRRRRGASGKSYLLRLTARPPRKRLSREVGVSGWKNTAASPKVNDLRSMEQCRQGKSAKWIRNLGEKGLARGLGSGGPDPNPSVCRLGLLELLHGEASRQRCRPRDGLGSGPFGGAFRASNDRLRS
ncbi:hypothetical protein OIU85_001108 [Salix viminalis]|uniref:Uncharacterized protein n=1 Tax=Salix viminalis TaxID=40686 RepID=A0A9Q0VN02_SALVM|nr:hypothetical protein OIU85_001108 [Salix viminalis]